jgi:type I restriction enzyme S subunit
MKLLKKSLLQKMFPKSGETVPEVRFPGFTDAWEQRKFAELACIRRGLTYKPNDVTDSGIRVLRSSNIDEDSFIENDDDVFVKESAVNISQVRDGDILITSANGSNRLVGKHAIITKAGQAVHGGFMLVASAYGNPYFLNASMSSKWYTNFVNMYVAGGNGAIGNLKKSDLENQVIRVPCEEEQLRLGQFFKSLDQTITLHQRKLESIKLLKKSLLQKMFPKSGETVPEVRFPGFTDAWEQRKLGEISERVRGNDGRMDLPTLTISAGNGWMNQEDRFSGNIAGTEQKNYTLLKKGQLSYNHGNSKLAKYGAVFELRTYEEALVPRVYHSFKTTNEADPAFIEYLFASKLPDIELSKLISSGARMNGLLNINYDQFMGISIKLPAVEEQIRIGQFFRNVDYAITLHQRKVEALQKLKKSLLQQMFV